ncbi:MAG TPA: 3-hydroxyacyl-ACP dehydratase FabZ family protein [Planctomycetota bacterium]|nr:3-hydroxyacyl-ACP dehydratase FabZ family protein [Planctomycetota bacterium]
MPTAAPLDLTGLDLDHVVIPRAEVYRTLAHRGRFMLVDGVLHFDPEHELIVGFKEIRADDWWAVDHIPGRPLFPGVLMVEAAAQLSSFDFMRRRPERDHSFLGFGGLESTRFRGTVEPPSRLLLAARSVRVRSNMFTYEAQGFVGEKLVFQTQILGVVI